MSLPSPHSFSLSVSSYFEWNSICLVICEIKSVLRHADFLQAVNLFFSSQKNVNRLKEIRMSLEVNFVLFATRFFPSRAAGTSSASSPQTFRLFSTKPKSH